MRRRAAPAPPSHEAQLVGTCRVADRLRVHGKRLSGAGSSNCGAVDSAISISSCNAQGDAEVEWQGDDVADEVDHPDRRRSRRARPVRSAGPESNRPCSFVITRTGGVAVLDPAKRRIAYFTAAGLFTRAFGPVSTVANDLAPAGGKWLVIDDESRGNLRLVSAATSHVVHESSAVPDGSLDAPYLFVFGDASRSAFTTSGLHPVDADGRIDYQRTGLNTDAGRLNARATSPHAFRLVLPSAEILTVTVESPDKRYMPIVTIDTLYWRNDGLRLFFRIGDLNGSSSPLTGLYYLNLSSDGRVIDTAHLSAPDNNEPNVKRHGFLDAAGRPWQMVVLADQVVLRR